MSPPPPRSTLFPYTTLFRSISSSTSPTRGSIRGCGPGKQGDAGAANRRRVRGEPHRARGPRAPRARSEEHTSELQSLRHLVCRLLLEKKKKGENHKIDIHIT